MPSRRRSFRRHCLNSLSKKYAPDQQNVYTINKYVWSKICVGVFFYIFCACVIRGILRRSSAGDRTDRRIVDGLRGGGLPVDAVQMNLVYQTKYDFHDAELPPEVFIFGYILWNQRNIFACLFIQSNGSKLTYIL